MRHGLAPIAERAIGIGGLGRSERGDRRGVVEAIGVAQPLVEVALGERIGGGDREMHLAEVVVQRDRGQRRALHDRGGQREPSAHRLRAALACAQAGHPDRRVEQRQLPR